MRSELTIDIFRSTRHKSRPNQPTRQWKGTTRFPCACSGEYAKFARNSGELTAEIDLLRAGLSNILCSRVRGSKRSAYTSTVNQAEESLRRLPSGHTNTRPITNERLTCRDINSYFCGGRASPLYPLTHTSNCLLIQICTAPFVIDARPLIRVCSLVCIRSGVHI